MRKYVQYLYRCRYCLCKLPEKQLKSHLLRAHINRTPFDPISSEEQDQESPERAKNDFDQISSDEYEQQSTEWASTSVKRQSVQIRGKRALDCFSSIIEVISSDEESNMKAAEVISSSMDIECELNDNGEKNIDTAPDRSISHNAYSSTSFKRKKLMSSETENAANTKVSIKSVAVQCELHKIDKQCALLEPVTKHSVATQCEPDHNENAPKEQITKTFAVAAIQCDLNDKEMKCAPKVASNGTEKISHTLYIFFSKTITIHICILIHITSFFSFVIIPQIRKQLIQVMFLT